MREKLSIYDHDAYVRRVIAMASGAAALIGAGVAYWTNLKHGMLGLGPVANDIFKYSAETIEVGAATVFLNVIDRRPEDAIYKQQTYDRN